MIEDLVYHDSVPVATIRGGVRYYIKTDHLGTPRLVTNQSGTVIWRWDSDPFGTSAPQQDPDGDGSVFVFNLRFPGQWFDAETGRHYNLFRDYDPALGRYVQSDPIGLAGGLSTYAYANGNPVRYADAEGLIAPVVWAAAVAYARCLAECALIEAAVAAMVCPPSVTAVAAACAVDCLNPLNWLPGSKIFKAGKKARQVQRAVKAVEQKRSSALGSKQSRTRGIMPAQGPSPEPNRAQLAGRMWKSLREAGAGTGTLTINLHGVRDLTDKTRKEVLDDYNAGTRLECPGCNRSRGAKPSS